jgi:5'-methylthioadenosine phosphorylase
MMDRVSIPTADKGFIGGSSTFSLNFPDDLCLPYVKTIERAGFDTPFGRSPEFTLFSVDEQLVLTVKMHGWREGISRADASRQVFWVFEQAGVKTLFAEGGVGSIRNDLAMRQFFVPDDYIDLSLRKDVRLSDRYLLIMRDPFCPKLTSILQETVSGLDPDRHIGKGVYVVTDGRHFESCAEVRMIEKLGGDVIGQTVCPEVYLAREIGACYAGIYLVVNRAEGVGEDWEHEELTDIFFNEASTMGRIIIEALRTKRSMTCNCGTLRKETLLKDGR